MKSFNRTLIFFISLNTILLELLQMKYLNVVLNSTSGFLIITLALFMFSFSSATFSFWNKILKGGINPRLIFATTLMVATSAIQLSTLRYMANALTDYDIVQEWPLSLFILLFTSLPYYFSGLSLLNLLNRNWQIKDAFQKNYYFDMLGLLTAVFIPHFAVGWLGPEKIMALALMPLALLIGAATWLKRSEDNATAETPLLKSITRLCLLAVLSFNFYILFFTKAAEPMNAMVVKYKNRTPDYQFEYSHWDPIARLDVINFSASQTHSATNTSTMTGGTRYLFYDGGVIGTNIYPFDGNYESLKEKYPLAPKNYFLRRSTVAAHLLKESSGARVYLFGVGAGQELKAALMYNPKEVYANELVRSVLDINTGLYRDFNGGIFNDPRVHILPGDGRIQLNRTTDQFDIIQIFSNYLSANLASGLAPHMITYLLTEQSLAEYINRLAPEGILQINQLGYARVLELIQKEWIKTQPLSELKKHIYVIENKNRNDFLTTVLFKKSEFTPEDEKKLIWLYQTTQQAGEDYEFIEAPNKPLTANSFFYEQNALIRKSDPLSTTSYASDEKPFFTYNNQSLINSYGLNRTVYIAFVLILILASLIYQFLNRSRLIQKKALYFFYLISGVSFILIQYALAAKLTKFLNSPDLAYPLVLAAFAAANMAVVPLTQKIKKKHQGLFLISLLSISCAALLTPMLGYAVVNWSDFSIGLLAFTLVCMVSLLPAYTFPVMTHLIEEPTEFNIAWLSNGIGLLIGSLAVHGLTLAIGLSSLLLLGLIIFGISLILVQK